MDITISGSYFVLYEPNVLDENGNPLEHMTTKELEDRQILRYIEDMFDEGDCISDSFEWNVKVLREYSDILHQYGIEEDDDAFEDFFVSYISEDYFREYYDKEYIFKKTIIDTTYSLSNRGKDGFNVSFDVDLCITLEQLCEKYLED